MEAIILIAALVGLVFGTQFLFRGSLVGGCLLFLLCITCFGHEFIHFEMGSAPLTIDRLVLVLLAGTYVFQRWIGRTDPKPFYGVDWVLAAFVLVLLVSTLSGDWRVFKRPEGSPLWRLIGGYLTPVAIYWIARNSPLTEKRVRFVQACLTAICEITHQWALVFPKYIADPKVGLHYGRARGPLVHGVSFGHYLGVCLLAALTWRASLGRLGQIILLLIAPLFLAGIFFSYTRSVWMGVGLGLLIVLACTLRGQWRMLLIGGVVAGGLMMSLTKLDGLVGFKREQSAAETRESAEIRVSFAYLSWKMFLDKPLFGFGFGHFYQDKMPYLADRSTQLNIGLLRPYVHHNTFLCLLTETGGVGLGLFLALMTMWGRTCWLLYRSPQSPAWVARQAVFTLGAMGVYSCQLAFHELSYTSLDNSLLFFLAGVTCGLRPLAEPQSARAVAPSAPSPTAGASYLRPAAGLG
jgi:O-antigen ligase